MIHSLTAKNFYAIDEKVEISFLVDENAPKNNGYARTKAGYRVSLVEDIIGPNASGKTNILRIIPLMKWLIVDSWDNNPNGPLPCRPFMPRQNDGVPTELGVVFELDDTVYLYEVHLASDIIVYEKLAMRTTSKERTTRRTLFVRSYNHDTADYNTKLKGFTAPAGLKDLLRRNATVLSTALRLNHQTSKKIAEFWQKTEFNVIQYGWVGSQLFAANQIMNLANTMTYYHQSPGIKEKAEEMLARYDLGFNSFRTEMLNNQLTMMAAHTFGDQKFDLSLENESSGTMQLLILLKHILVVLENGGIAVIDEFDSSLHPDMVHELIGLFTDAAANPKRGQLLFSTHNQRILAQLDKYQIVLTEKNDQGATEAWRLDEIKGVRSDDNYYTKYMSGAYGATPKIG